MANEPAQGAGRTPTGGAGLAGARMAGVRPCPGCNTLISVHATVCPNCGENVAVKEKTVRCRRCHSRASSNLTICPHCGRDLQPATTRWLTWGLPLLVVLLLAGLLLVRLSRGNLAEWAQTQSERVGRLVESLTSRIQPEFTVALIPPSQDPDDPLVAQAIQSSAESGAGATVSNSPDVLPVAPPPADTAVQTATVPADSGAAGATEDNAAATVQPASENPTAEPTATATAAATATPATTDAPPTATTQPPTATTQPATATTQPAATTSATTAAQATPAANPATPQAADSAVTRTMTGTVAGMVAGAATQAAARTATAAATPAATVTAAAATPSPEVVLLDLLTPTPITAGPAVREVYTVRRNDTLFDIATLYDVSVEDLLAFNNLTEDDVYTIQPGDALNIPAPTPVGAPTATPGPTPAVYTVRPGDTISGIARGLGVTMEELMAANDLTLNDARTLQPGAVLALPSSELATPTPAATPSIAPSTTPTAAPATPSATPVLAATATAALRVDAPRLRSPENGAALNCTSQNTLNWLAVPSVRPTDVYLVHLGYVNDIAANGAEEIIWVITQQQPAGATFWQLDNDFCGLAPATQGKQWRWYVEVAEKTSSGLQPVSPTSTVWGFAWQ